MKNGDYEKLYPEGGQLPSLVRMMAETWAAGVGVSWAEMNGGEQRNLMQRMETAFYRAPGSASTCV
jgi:hypothetical protein